jgi:hypothetical protein
MASLSKQGVGGGEAQGVLMFSCRRRFSIGYCSLKLRFGLVLSKEVFRIRCRRLLISALTRTLVRQLRGLALLRRVGVPVGLPRPSCPLSGLLGPFTRAFPLTYLAGERRIRPGRAEHSLAHTAEGRYSAASHMADGCRTQFRARGRRPWA